MEYRSKRWHFPTYNFTISNLWSPFLVEAAIFGDYNGVSTSEVQLQLDKLDKSWIDAYPSLDYIIISSGKWFLKAAVYHENNTVVGCHICPQGKNLTETGFDFAYEKALSSVLDTHRGIEAQRKNLLQDIFTGPFPERRVAQWRKLSTDGPAKEGKIDMKEVNKILRTVELAEFDKAATKAAEFGVSLKLIDFTNLLLSHSGAYRQFQPFAEDKNATVQNDCLHWCLPGPIDYLNNVIMEMVVNG